MYTFNYYVYGHKMSANSELNNELWEFDPEFSQTINGKYYEVNFPYHGGQVNGDVLSCVFGTTVTDDDQNPNLINEIRNFNEDDYKNDYLDFLQNFKNNLNANLGVPGEEDYDLFVNKLISFLDSTDPELYSVEASS